MKGLSVVIPALDEQEGIAGVLDEINRVMADNQLEYEIVVVDDGSTDRTAEIAEQRGARVIRHPYTAGYGASIQQAIAVSKFDVVATVDADGTYPVGRFPDLLKYIGEYDMVVGARSGRYYRATFLKNPSRKVFQLICEFVTGRSIPDGNSGFRIFKKDMVMKFKDNLCQGFSFSTTITLEMLLNGNFIKFVPIEFYRRKGKSKVNFIRDTLRTTQILAQTILYVNPIKLFLIMAAGLSLIALISLLAWLLAKSFAAWLLFALSLVSSVMVMALGFVAELLRKIKDNAK